MEAVCDWATGVAGAGVGIALVVEGEATLAVVLLVVVVVEAGAASKLVRPPTLAVATRLLELGSR